MAKNLVESEPPSPSSIVDDGAATAKAVKQSVGKPSSLVENPISEKSVAIKKSEDKPVSPSQTPISERKDAKKPVVKGGKFEGGKSESDSSWRTSDFFKDAAWFATNCGLPNSGDAPLKISYITDDNLQAACFGPSTRNGYKLNNCTGIPIDDILALSHVIDGFDKPVNGVLAHSFAKGVYAERILKKKIDWASYASSKLRGQIVQHERDGKGKPDGPPCVRKPWMYVSPSESKDKSRLEGMEVATVDNRADLPLASEESGPESASLLRRTSVLPNVLNLADETPKAPQANDGPPQPHLLITIMKGKISMMKSHEEEIRSRLGRVECSLAQLKFVESEGLKAETTLTQQCKSLEIEVMKIQEQLATEDRQSQDLVTDIELELNKQGESDDIEEVNNDLVTMLEEKQKAIASTVDHLKSLLEATNKDLESTRGVIAVNREKLLRLPKTFEKLTSVSRTLEADKLKVEDNLKAQQAELSILSRTFEKPIALLRPTFTVTSSHIGQSNFSFLSCPVCCFGYLQFNWIPASCGHAYHPTCLFHLICNSKEAPKCMCCSEVFSARWMRTWGLPWAWDEESSQKFVVTADMAMHMKDAYGKNSSRLESWRVIASNLNKEVQRKGDFDAEAEECVQSVLPSSTIDLTDDVSHDGLSKNPLLLHVKLEKDEGNKRPISDVDSVPVAARKVKHMFSEETGHSKPNAILPSSRETNLEFEPYTSIKSPCRDPSASVPYRPSKLEKESVRILNLAVFVFICRVAELE